MPPFNCCPQHPLLRFVRRPGEARCKDEPASLRTGVSAVSQATAGDLKARSAAVSVPGAVPPLSEHAMSHRLTRLLSTPRSQAVPQSTPSPPSLSCHRRVLGKVLPAPQQKVGFVISKSPKLVASWGYDGGCGRPALVVIVLEDRGVSGQEADERCCSEGRVERDKRQRGEERDSGRSRPGPCSHGWE